MSNKQNITLIDADSLIFVLAWNEQGKEKKDGSIVYTKAAKSRIILSTKKRLDDILVATKADKYMGFYQDSDDDTLTKEDKNFRYKIYPDYKGQRKPAHPCIQHWRPTIMEVFKEYGEFIPVCGFESDDAVCFLANHFKEDYNVTIAANDKDTLQNADVFYYDLAKNAFGIPDVFKKGSTIDKPRYLEPHEKQKITQFDAILHTATQLIIGDGADNIKGVPGKGPAAAKKALKDCKTVKDVRRAVVDLYKDTYAKRFKKLMSEKVDIDPAELSEAMEKYTTKAQIDRFHRIKQKQYANGILNEEYGGSLKHYFKVQFRMLVMLQDVPEGFPTEPVEVPQHIRDLQAANEIDNLDDIVSILDI